MELNTTAVYKRKHRVKMFVRVKTYFGSPRPRSLKTRPAADEAAGVATKTVSFHSRVMG